MAKVKNNTCGPSSLHKRLQRQLEGIQKHLEVHPNDNLSRARVSRINELLRG
jgi:ribosomal protein S15P/S13E